VFPRTLRQSSPETPECSAIDSACFKVADFSNVSTAMAGLLLDRAAPEGPVRYHKPLKTARVPFPEQRQEVAPYPGELLSPQITGVIGQ
jgi:hypothetical protein